MSEWKEVELVDCTVKGNISYGIVQPGQDEPNGVPILRVNNFENGILNTDSILKVNSRIDSKHSKTRLKGGEVLLTLVGSTGQTAIVPEKLKGWNVARAVAVIDVKPEIGAKWINLWLRSNQAHHYLDSRANTTVQKTLNLKDVKSIPVSIPPENERKSIENIIYSLEEKIELNRQMNQTLEAMAQALFKSWFVDFDPVLDNAIAQGNEIPEELQVKAAKRRHVIAIPMSREKQSPYKGGIKQSQSLKPLLQTNPSLAAQFPSSFVFNETLGKCIPEGWEVKTIDEVTSLIIDHRGKTPKKLGGDWVDSGYPAISAKNIKDGKLIRHDMIRFVDDTIYSKWMKEPVQKGDIIMTSEAPMGEMFFVAEDTSYCLSQRLYGIRANGINSTPMYLYSWLQTEIARGDLEARCTGTTVTGIKQSELRKVVVLSPSKQILEEYEAKINALYSRINTSNKESETLTQLRDSLLPELISGRVRVNGLEKWREQKLAMAAEKKAIYNSKS
ncbi:restriction endonuclease subunit S [Algoriphagus formosus]|uniref:restriction endonuclease subunit S n=1 Tax=Algoriphagus formosus TaxID=2007308 RepID=UPI003F6F89CD